MQPGFYTSKFQHHTRLGDMGIMEINTIGLSLLRVTYHENYNDNFQSKGSILCVFQQTPNSQKVLKD